MNGYLNGSCHSFSSGRVTKSSSYLVLPGDTIWSQSPMPASKSKLYQQVWLSVVNGLVCSLWPGHILAECSADMDINLNIYVFVQSSHEWWWPKGWCRGARMALKDKLCFDPNLLDYFPKNKLVNSIARSRSLRGLGVGRRRISVSS